MAHPRKMASFVHLRVKSAYSLLEGAVRPKELAMLAAESGMPAVAVTDSNNLFGVYESADSVANAMMQTIWAALLSVELVASPVTQQGRLSKSLKLPLLVQNDVGRRNPTKHQRAAYLEAVPGD